jgi:hypothetical protein
MDKIGLPGSGVDLVVDDYYHANIKAEDPNREQAFNWLVENGHGDLLKVTVTCVFARGDYDKAEKLKAILVTNGYAPAIDQGVPWNTLTAWLKEQLRKGSVVPLELFGATIGRIVKIKMRKN